MSKLQQENKVVFRIPETIFGTTDLSRLIRELESLDDFMYQATLRTPGSNITPPRTSKVLNEVSEMNGLSLLEASHRKSLVQALTQLQDIAPTVHISFASEPSQSFLEEIVRWYRSNINSLILINVGLQPSIVVGCTVRTTNKVFDMSLRNRFDKSREILIKKMEEVNA